MAIKPFFGFPCLDLQETEGLFGIWHLIMPNVPEASRVYKLLDYVLKTYHDIVISELSFCLFCMC